MFSRRAGAFFELMSRPHLFGGEDNSCAREAQDPGCQILFLRRAPRSVASCRELWFIPGVLSRFRGSSRHPSGYRDGFFIPWRAWDEGRLFGAYVRARARQNAVGSLRDDRWSARGTLRSSSSRPGVVRCMVLMSGAPRVRTTDGFLQQRVSGPSLDSL